MSSSIRPERGWRLLLGAALAALVLALGACAPQQPDAPEEEAEKAEEAEEVLTAERPGLPEEEGAALLLPDEAPEVERREGLTSVGYEGAIELRWPEVSEAESYIIHWSTSPEVAPQESTAITDVEGNSYRHTGLENGQAYYYFVSAVNAEGDPVTTFNPTYNVPYNYDGERYPEFQVVVPRLGDSFATLAERYLDDPAKGWMIRDFNGIERVEPFEAVLIPRQPYQPGGLTPQRYKTVPILTYHHVSLSSSNKMTVPLTKFEEQMAYLAENDFTPITLDQYVAFMNFEGPVPEKPVVITFDDGWASTLELALPVLKKYDLRATVFIYTDLIGNAEEALTWEQVNTLAEDGTIDVQCHTKSHRNLRMKPEETFEDYVEAVRTELTASRETLEEHTGKRCEYLAYPYGATNHLVVAMAQKLGYKAAFTVDRGSNPFFITNYRVLRSMVYGEFDMQRFVGNLEVSSSRVLQ